MRYVIAPLRSLRPYLFYATSGMTARWSIHRFLAIYLHKRLSYRVSWRDIPDYFPNFHQFKADFDVALPDQKSHLTATGSAFIVALTIEVRPDMSIRPLDTMTTTTMTAMTTIAVLARGRA